MQLFLHICVYLFRLGGALGVLGIIGSFSFLLLRTKLSKPRFYPVVMVGQLGSDVFAVLAAHRRYQNFAQVAQAYRAVQLIEHIAQSALFQLEKAER